jgi:phosphoribosylaminoimidazole-succinocarboxamide synthase
MIVFETNLSHLGTKHQGKVRDIYDLGEYLIIISTDRISAFDIVMPNPIPDKGYILNQISSYWFKLKRNIVPNHFVTDEIAQFPAVCQQYGQTLEGRSMLVKKTKPLPIECIVRGYIYGSAWNDYQKTSQICGYQLPQDMQESEKLSEPLFTPSTKAKQGHDINITFEEMVSILGDKKLAQKLKEYSLALYNQAAEIALKKGIIIVDTKLEFGLDKKGEVILIDEFLTPDSSRFWPKDQYQPGRPQPSFDKQYLRDYLEGIGWDKNHPAPSLPQEVITKTRQRYIEALNRIVE